MRRQFERFGLKFERYSLSYFLAILFRNKGALRLLPLCLKITNTFFFNRREKKPLALPCRYASLKHNPEFKQELEKYFTLFFRLKISILVSESINRGD